MSDFDLVGWILLSIGWSLAGLIWSLPFVMAFVWHYDKKTEQLKEKNNV